MKQKIKKVSKILSKVVDFTLCYIITAFALIFASPYIICEFISDCLFKKK